MKSLAIVGAGGHAKSVIASIDSRIYEFKGVILKEPDPTNQFPVIGYDNDLEAIKTMVDCVIIAIGSIGDIRIREKMESQLSKLGFQFATVIDPSAIIAEDVIIGEGTFVGKRAIINAGAKIGSHAIINSGAIIEHDCIIGDFCHIGPGAVLGGSVRVAHGTHIGIGSTLIQGLTIGQGCLIGAGSVVVNNIRDAAKAYGNPCKEIK